MTTAPRTDLPLRDLMTGALYALILLQLVQLAAGLAQVPPHPAPAVLPIIAATAALGLFALPLVRAGRRAGAYIGIAFCAAAMIGMGPHKLFLQDGGVIAPVALTGFALELAFIAAAIMSLRR